MVLYILVLGIAWIRLSSQARIPFFCFWFTVYLLSLPWLCFIALSGIGITFQNSLCYSAGSVRHGRVCNPEDTQLPAQDGLLRFHLQVSAAGICRWHRSTACPPCEWVLVLTGRSPSPSSSTSLSSSSHTLWAMQIEAVCYCIYLSTTLISGLPIFCAARGWTHPCLAILKDIFHPLRKF